MSVDLKKKQQDYMYSPTTSFRMQRKVYNQFCDESIRLGIKKSKIIQFLIKEFLKDPDRVLEIVL